MLMDAEIDFEESSVRVADYQFNWAREPAWMDADHPEHKHKMAAFEAREAVRNKRREEEQRRMDEENAAAEQLMKLAEAVDAQEADLEELARAELRKARARADEDYAGPEAMDLRAEADILDGIALEELGEGQESQEEPVFEYIDEEAEVE